MRVKYVATNCVESPALCHRPASVERVERFLTVSLLWNAMLMEGEIRKRWSGRGTEMGRCVRERGKEWERKVRWYYSPTLSANHFYTSQLYVFIVKHL